MTDETPSQIAVPPSMPMHGSNLRKGAKWFFAEFVVVVAGILVAMALSAWYQGRQEAASERSYLQLLSRDLQGTVQDMEATAKFEQAQVQDGLRVYRALSAAALPADTGALSGAISRLSQRKTMVLKNSTYQDLVSTGNFHLIRDVALRDRIADFYQRTGLQFDIINRNNATFVDQMFAVNLLGSGLFVTRTGSNVPELQATDRQLEAQMQGGYLSRPDAMWSLPAEDPRWAMLKSNVVQRIRIAALGNEIAHDRAAAARALKTGIDDALDR